MAALLLALAPPTAMAGVVWLYPWRSTTMLALASGVFLFFCILAGLLLLEVEGVQFTLTDDGLTRYSRWRKPQSLRWSEIERIEYSAFNRWFIVHGAGRTIHVSRFFVGVAAFVEMARRRVGMERCMAASAAMDRVK
jgi:hypothetical protein